MPKATIKFTYEDYKNLPESETKRYPEYWLMARPVKRPLPVFKLYLCVCWPTA